MCYRPTLALRSIAVLAATLLVPLAFAQGSPQQEPSAQGPPPDRPIIGSPVQPGPPLPAPGPRRLRRADRLPRAPARMAVARRSELEGGIAALLRQSQVQRELGITNDQRRKLEDIGFNTARASIQQRAALEVLRLDLEKLKRADAPDRAAIDNKIQEITQAEGALMRTRVNAELDVRGVLTKEQRDMLRERAQNFRMRQRGRIQEPEGEGPMAPPPARDRGTPLPKIPPPPDK